MRERYGDRAVLAAFYAEIAIEQIRIGHEVNTFVPPRRFAVFGKILAREHCVRKTGIERYDSRFVFVVGEKTAEHDFDLARDVVHRLSVSVAVTERATVQ